MSFIWFLKAHFIAWCLHHFTGKLKVRLLVIYCCQTVYIQSAAWQRNLRRQTHHKGLYTHQLDWPCQIFEVHMINKQVNFSASRLLLISTVVKLDLLILTVPRLNSDADLNCTVLYNLSGTHHFFMFNIWTSDIQGSLRNCFSFVSSKAAFHFLA